MSMASNIVISGYFVIGGYGKSSKGALKQGFNLEPHPSYYGLPLFIFPTLI